MQDKNKLNRVQESRTDNINNTDNRSHEQESKDTSENNHQSKRRRRDYHGINPYPPHNNTNNHLHNTNNTNFGKHGNHGKYEKHGKHGKHILDSLCKVKPSHQSYLPAPTPGENHSGNNPTSLMADGGSSKQDQTLFPHLNILEINSVADEDEDTIESAPPAPGDGASLVPINLMQFRSTPTNSNGQFQVDDSKRPVRKPRKKKQQPKRYVLTQFNLS